MSNGRIGSDPLGDLERAIQSDRIPADPIALLAEWVPSDDDPARPTATLATIGGDGIPNARTVLLSTFRRGRAGFHTDATSEKARELTERPVAALVLFWPDRSRQVVLRGLVVRASDEDDRLAYERRSRYLQVLAWLNTPAVAAAPRDERERAWSAFDTAHGELSPPSTWTGYELIPESIVFWEGSASAPGRRARYLRQGDGWTVELLPG